MDLIGLNQMTPLTLSGGLSPVMRQRTFGEVSTPQPPKEPDYRVILLICMVLAAAILIGVTR